MPKVIHIANQLEIGANTNARKVQIDFVQEGLGCLIQATLDPPSTRQLIIALQTQLLVLEHTPVNQVKA